MKVSKHASILWHSWQWSQHTSDRLATKLFDADATAAACALSTAIADHTTDP